jgi:hypothetical protein
VENDVNNLVDKVLLSTGGRKRGIDGVEMNREIQVLSETFPRF